MCQLIIFKIDLDHEVRFSSRFANDNGHIEKLSICIVCECQKSVSALFSSSFFHIPICSALSTIRLAPRAFILFQMIGEMLLVQHYFYFLFFFLIRVLLYIFVNLTTFSQI